jgi:hypothetical protein
MPESTTYNLQSETMHLDSGKKVGEKPPSVSTLVSLAESIVETIFDPKFYEDTIYKEHSALDHGVA